MNITLRELKANRRSLIIWTVAIALLIYIVMTLYPAMVEDAALIDDLIDLIPEGWIQAFNLHRLNITDIMGYYAIDAYFLHTLFGSIFAAMLGAGIFAKEENEKTIEFLLAKPVTRSRIVTEKLLACLVYLIIFNLLIFITVYFSFEQFKQNGYDLSVLILLSVGPFLIHLTFVSLGALLSMFVTHKKSIYPAAIGLVLGLYFLNLLSTLSDRYEFLRYFTPFQYADAADIIIDERLDGTYLALFLAVNVVAVTASYLLYNRKDLSA